MLFLEEGVDCRASRVHRNLLSCLVKATSRQPAASHTGPATVSMLGERFTLEVEATADCRQGQIMGLQKGDSSAGKLRWCDLHSTNESRVIRTWLQES